MVTAGMNRINVVVPGNSTGGAAERDAFISRMIGTLGLTFDFYRYNDTTSGNGGWAYLAIGYAINTNGTLTIGTVSMSGMAIAPSGSNLVAMTDPGPGTVYTSSWSTVSTLPRIATSGDGGGGGGSAPNQNNNIWHRRINANSPTVVADFTNAISELQNIIGSTYWYYYRYIDSVSSAWSVYAIALYFGTSTLAIPQPTCAIVTCSGTPNPPTGSSAPAVSMPAFTQSFTGIGSPLDIGPGR